MTAFDEAHDILNDIIKLSRADYSCALLCVNGVPPECGHRYRPLSKPNSEGYIAVSEYFHLKEGETCVKLHRNKENKDPVFHDFDENSIVILSGPNIQGQPRRRGEILVLSSIAGALSYSSIIRLMQHGALRFRIIGEHSPKQTFDACNHPEYVVSPLVGDRKCHICGISLGRSR
jgi:hypothetical protein